MRNLLILILLHQSIFVFAQKKYTVYFPSSNEWQQKPAHSVFDTVILSDAIQFAIAHESKAPRSMELSQTMSFGKEPFGFGIGPFADRGDPTGLIIHRGYLVAKWGNPAQVEMTHSVTKSFLSVVVGLAVDKKIIRSVHDTIEKYISPIELFDPSNQNKPFNNLQMIQPFSSEHNRRLTWDVMLRQTSDWEGTLWGKPDWADRPDADPNKWLNRKRNEPGAVYEYNDVRVNALALAATSFWRKPLPEVLKEHIMDPIGASTTWRWYGYNNSWIVLDGKPVQSVSGGGHWGGGMFISAYDMARFGLLTFHNGNWNGKQLISEEWIKQSIIPTKAQPTYGYMNFFLNTDKKYLPNAPASAFVHVGNGTNIIYVDKENELVMVIRWIENRNIDEMVQKVLSALR